MIQTGVQLITAERERQLSQEGFTEEHDKQYRRGDLAAAGAAYALDAVSRYGDYPDKLKTVLSGAARASCPLNWMGPSGQWWKPTPEDDIRQLVKAGALIAAEIDKLQRERREAG